MNGHFDIGGVTPTRYFFSIAVVLGLLFAFTSGDDGQALWLVVLQWQLQSVVPMALLIGAHILLLRSASFTRLNGWFALGLSGTLGATLFAPVALGIEILLEPGPRMTNLAAELVNEWISVAPPVVISWIALNAPWILGYRLEQAGSNPEDHPAQQPSATPAPEFMSQLPEEKRGELLLLKSELHYLQVVTTAGSSLILYNLGDAVAQLDESRGMLVHRSYWVAYDAIEALNRRGRQGELQISGGHSAPVSRSQLPRLRQRLAGS